MPAALVQALDPETLADRNAQLSGTVPLARLPRLCEVLRSTAGEAEATMRFSREAGKVIVQGAVRAQLSLTCQRCLQEMQVPVDAQLALMPVGSPEEALEVPADFEPWMMRTGAMRGVDAVEEELLLAVPLAPRHASVEDCGPLARYLREPEEREADAQMGRPFEVLKNLKQD